MTLLNNTILIFGFFAVVLVSAYKTDNWPPKALIANIDINGTISKCLQQCQANIKEIENFELTNDFKNLPSSASLKCYLHCCFLSFGVYETPNSTRLNLAQMMDSINGLTKDQQDIIFRMTRGCLKRVSHIKDPTEFTYIMNICAKENDNEHFYVYY